MKTNSFKILKNSQFAKFAKFRIKNHFFPRHAIPTNFALHSHYTVDSQYRVWFDLDNSLIRWKNLFLKLLFREIRKIPYENPIFFRDNLFLFCFTMSLHWWYSIPSLVWFGQLLDPMKKIFFLNSQNFAIREIRKIPYENPIFFQGKLYVFFALHCHYTGDIQYRVWFDLDNSLTRWKRFFLKFSKNLNSRNSQNSVSKPNFFLGTLYQKLFCFTLSLHWWYSIPRLVWFGQLLNPMKKTYF